MKKPRLLKIVCHCIAALSLSLHANAASQPVVVGKTPLATLLNWVDDKQNGGICHGYYIDIPIDFPQQLDGNDYLMHADNVQIVQNQPWQYIGNVTIKQPEREVLANRASSIYDTKTHRITQLEASGNVRLRQPGMLFFANHAKLDTLDKKAEFTDVAYRLLRQSAPRDKISYHGKSVYKVVGQSGRGTAKTAKQLKPKVYELHHANYSTCKPGSCAWQVKASHIKVDDNKKLIKAYNGSFWFFGVPIMYTPYFSFSYDNTRKSGFLLPIVGYSRSGGMELGEPYYFNFAPNVDMTFSPIWYSKRDWRLNNKLRYLTWSSLGQLYISLLPHDRAFAKFRQQKLIDNPNAPGAERLKNATATRAYLSWQQRTQLTPAWNSYIDISYVSDDYYFRDFGSDTDELTRGQVKQAINVNYQAKHWSVLSRLSNYQTLHPVDTAESFLDQYARVPDITAVGNYPHDHWDFTLLNQFTYFAHPLIANYFKTNLPSVTGGRLNIAPSVEYDASQAWGYIKPQVKWQTTGYLLSGWQQNNIPYNAAPGHQKNILRSLPVIDVDSGLYFDRNTNLFGDSYRQTFEPRLYYVYVPYQNQQDIPLFDASERLFTYDSIFRSNRFDGLDRVSDANQFGLGLTSRFFNQKSDIEAIDLSIGEIIYLQHRRVTLSNRPSSFNNTHFSPIAAQANYYMWHNIRLTGDLVWDPNQKIIDDSRVNLQYYLDQKHIFNIGYTDQRYSELDPGNSLSDSSNSDVHSISASFTWGLPWHWQAMGAVDINLAKGYVQDYMGGLQYDSCCWALRVVASRQFTFLSTNNSPQYDTRYYIEWLFKGLSSIGYNSASSLLESKIPGYNGSF